jgi:hypothetical protein
MAFPTKDGKLFGSKFKQRKYDSVHSSELGDKKVGEGAKSTGSPAKGAEPKAMSRTNDQGEAKFSSKEASAPDNNVKGMNMGGEGAQQPVPSAVVAQHGKAVHVHTSHDHESNKHHVHSVHADGHVSDSDHASAQDAHEAAKQLGGGDEKEMNDNPLEEAQEGPEPDGFQMPRLA